jgi:hypothetical protein
MITTRKGARNVKITTKDSSEDKGKRQGQGDSGGSRAREGLLPEA